MLQRGYTWASPPAQGRWCKYQNSIAHPPLECRCERLLWSSWAMIDFCWRWLVFTYPSRIWYILFAESLNSLRIYGMTIIQGIYIFQVKTTIEPDSCRIGYYAFFKSWLDGPYPLYLSSCNWLHRFQSQFSNLQTSILYPVCIPSSLFKMLLNGNIRWGSCSPCPETWVTEAK